MQTEVTFALIHSPLVGPVTWQPVARELRSRGWAAEVPELKDHQGSDRPFWLQHAESAAEQLSEFGSTRPVTYVGHSGAGALLPAIRQRLPNPVSGYVYVDAGLPGNGTTRLELMQEESPEWAARFRQQLLYGGRYPTWSSDDLKDIVPDEEMRAVLVRSIRARDLDFFDEPIPVFDGWPDGPCRYIHFSAPYDRSAARARDLGWPVVSLPGSHFHMLVDTVAVADALIAGRNEKSR